eukprot:scaffold108780_cov17-Prasinocladus_malaysianus.AAC.1
MATSCRTASTAGGSTKQRASSARNTRPDRILHSSIHTSAVATSPAATDYGWPIPPRVCTSKQVAIMLMPSRIAAFSVS